MEHRPNMNSYQLFLLSTTGALPRVCLPSHDSRREQAVHGISTGQAKRPGMPRDPTYRYRGSGLTKEATLLSRNSFRIDCIQVGKARRKFQRQIPESLREATLLRSAHTTSKQFLPIFRFRYAAPT